jgi:hypothetical protein
MKPDAWIQWTVFGNKILAFKKPDASPHCYTGIDIKERLEPLYTAATIRKWLMEEPSAAMIHRAVESYDSNDGSMVEYCRGLLVAKLEELK